MLAVLLAVARPGSAGAQEPHATASTYDTRTPPAASVESRAAPATRLRASPLPLALQPSRAPIPTPERAIAAAPVRGPALTSTKRWGLAIPGMLGGNALPMIYNEFRQPWKEISRSSPYTWKLYWRWWEWDDNHFVNNQLAHPIQGQFYYNAARSNGFNYLWSLGFTAVGSYFWECCGERRQASVNDFVTTTLGGAALGEMLFRAAMLIVDNTETGIDRIGREAALLPLNAELFMARGVYGHWTDTTNPADRSPDEWGLAVGSGLRWASGSTHPFVDVQLRYGSLFQSSAQDPFDLFTVDGQFNGANQPVGLIRVRGLLYQRTLDGALLESSTDEGYTLKGVLTQNYDYLDSSPDPAALEPGAPVEELQEGYRYGAQSFGLGLATAFALGSARVNALGEITGIPMGAVNSLHSRYVGIMGEREREYDFGVGFGFGARGGVAVPNWLMGSASYQYARLFTLSGSNVLLPDGTRVESTHRVHAATVGVQVELENILSFITRHPAPWARHFWLGADWLMFKKRSDYLPSGGFVPEDHTSHQFRLVLKWDYARSYGMRIYGQP